MTDLDPRVPDWSIDPLRPVETDLPPARRSTHVERERSGAVIGYIGAALVAVLLIATLIVTWPR